MNRTVDGDEADSTDHMIVCGMAMVAHAGEQVPNSIRPTLGIANNDRDDIVLLLTVLTEEGVGQGIHNINRYGIAEPHGALPPCGSAQRPTLEGSVMIRQVTWAGAMVLILVAALYHPSGAAAHGTASGEDDPCLRRVGESLVHFSIYQPQYELNGQYCTDIPKEGDTFLVVDLVDPSLRNEPVGMRVMKGNGSNKAEDQIVADIRPSTHPDGVLRGEARLDEGLYTVTIAAEKQNLMRRPQYLLRVHMTDYQKLVRTVAISLIGVLVTAWLGFKLIRPKWLQNWWATPHS